MLCEGPVFEMTENSWRTESENIMPNFSRGDSPQEKVPKRNRPLAKGMQSILDVPRDVIPRYILAGEAFVKPSLKASATDSRHEYFSVTLREDGQILQV